MYPWKIKEKINILNWNFNIEKKYEKENDDFGIFDIICESFFINHLSKFLNNNQEHSD